MEKGLLTKEEIETMIKWREIPVIQGVKTIIPDKYILTGWRIFLKLKTDNLFCKYIEELPDERFSRHDKG